MKVSQVKVLYNERSVNEWLLLNSHLEVVNITVSSRGESCGSKDTFLIHFKANAVKSVADGLDSQRITLDMRP